MAIHKTRTELGLYDNLRMKSRKSSTVFFENFQLKQSHLSRDGIISIGPSYCCTDLEKWYYLWTGSLNGVQLPIWGTCYFRQF
jgi:hypothetical protein